MQNFALDKTSIGLYVRGMTDHPSADHYHYPRAYYEDIVWQPKMDQAFRTLFYDMWREEGVDGGL